MARNTKEFVDIVDMDLFAGFLKENKLTKPTEVQAEAIPQFLEGHNLQVQAQTGSGKTLSYLLPLFQKLKETEADIKNQKAGSPRAIILLPIKELAMQVSDECKKISHHAKMRVRLALGGEKGKKVSTLKKQTFDILIGGPGRIKSMIEKKEIRLDELEYLIIDEADQLLDMGFMRELKAIRRHLTSSYQACLVSATMADDFDMLKADFFSGMEFKSVSLVGSHGLSQTIETFNIALDYTEKNAMLDVFVKKEAKGSGIIFVNQKEKAVEVYNYMKQAKLHKNLYVSHGDITAKERSENFKKFKSTGGILITTDMAARGIDIKTLQWVLNYDLPFEAVYYIHRSGRVGRAGRAGSVYNFVTKKDQKLIGQINDAIKNQDTLKIDPIFLKSMAKKSGAKKVAKKVARRGPAPQKKTSKTTTRSTSRTGGRTPSRTSKTSRGRRR
ncbi:DEAD/DEAH box helicase [Halobacteriovorax sp. XZX-3]|uniref:DEAD/DEAH box helicase n=1 Tax=unclassified Halobacteriovorax TaxID=2639665 RepID=UPI003721CDBF